MKTKDKLIRDLALEIEAENIAREVPTLTLECEYMWLLLNDIRESIRIGEPVNHYIDKINKLEDNIKQK
tara:strand:+ start:470 stop:676 length:207 start_codon:yes stop_codon:yes gene_type:complete